MRDPREDHLNKEWNLPSNRREARQWIRQHWSTVIAYADMGDAPDNRYIGEVWDDECRKISLRLATQ